MPSPANHWAEGGKGAVALAEAVVEACEKPSNFQFLYPLDLGIKEKIETIVAKIYGGAGVELLAAGRGADRRLHRARL